MTAAAERAPPRARLPTAAVVLSATLLGLPAAAPGSARAQEAPRADAEDASAGAAVQEASAPSPALDTTSLADGPGASMRMKLERTIFQVDVLTLELRFGPATARRIEAARGGGGVEGSRADAVAAAAVGSGDAFARIRFLRDVDLDRFLDATRSSMRRAVAEGLLADTAFAAVSEGLPRWFSFLEERGLQEGDELLYRIRGDTLRTVYRSAAGNVLLDQTDVSPERPRAVLGGYLAPGTDFREPLLESLGGDG